MENSTRILEETMPHNSSAEASEELASEQHESADESRAKALGSLATGSGRYSKHARQSAHSRQQAERTEKEAENQRNWRSR